MKKNLFLNFNFFKTKGVCYAKFNILYIIIVDIKNYYFLFHVYFINVYSLKQRCI